jgi:hypothetical protein
MDCFGGDEEDLARIDRRRRRRPSNLIPERPFEDIDDLFARMLVLEGRRFGLMSTRFWTTSRPGALRSCC